MVNREADKLSTLAGGTHRGRPAGHFRSPGSPDGLGLNEHSLLGFWWNWDTALSWVTTVAEKCALGRWPARAVCLGAQRLDTLCPTSPLRLSLLIRRTMTAPYSYLSDFFYVWLAPHAREHPRASARWAGRAEDQEIVVDRPHELTATQRGHRLHEAELTKAFAEGRRILAADGIGTVVFASKNTSSWEAIVGAILEAGWVITASWPIDTEMQNKVAAIGQARLASSVHLVCRPREHPDGSLREEIGDWRDVLQELPGRIHEWMPRLAKEGVVGADAIFACLGPALEVFSRYSRVEKASGEVTLGEYLQHVWAVVAREALGMIFEGAGATGFERTRG